MGLIEQIEEMGMLDTVKESDKEDIIETAKDLFQFIGVKENGENGDVKNKLNPAQFLILPTIIKIYNKSGKTKFNIKKLYTEINEYFNKYNSELNEMNIMGIDGEMEILSMFIENYKE